MSTAKFNTWVNPDGTENYKCRAWVNFNGTGTVAIRAAGNVTSITDNGTGDYTVNFTTAMPDANYSLVMGSVGATVSNLANIVVIKGDSTTGATNKTTSAVTIQSGSTSSSLLRDAAEINVAFFR